MPNPTIPNGFSPVTQNYSFGGPGGVARTAVDGGMPRQALQWDRGVQQFRCTLILKPLEFSVWSAFYHHTIKKGALLFDMPLDSGFGPMTHTVSMIPDSYQATRTGGAMTAVNFVVEAESAAYAMTDADAQALIDLFNQYDNGLGDLLARLDTFANQDTLVLQ